MVTSHDTASARAELDVDVLAAELERIVIGAVALTTQALGYADTGFELTFPQWRALLVLGEEPDGIRIGAVASRVGVTLPATSRLLRRLERRGLTALAVDDVDRRATRVRLTERGRVVRDTILAYRRAALREIAAALPASERRRAEPGIRAIAGELARFG